MTYESLKLYKLIILYLLSKANQDITNAILSDFILEHGYTDYLSIQETLNALAEDGMILLNQTYATTYYTIAERGWEALNFFSSQLPLDTKRQINQYLKEKKIQIVEDTTIRTDYSKVNSTEYLSRCTVIERGSVLFEIALCSTSEPEAREICERFKKKSDEIYGYLFKTLTMD